MTDLLFYHLELRCYIVVELKNNEFKPEYAGQLSFYVTAVDEIMKRRGIIYNSRYLKSLNWSRRAACQIESDVTDVRIAIWLQRI